MFEGVAFCLARLDWDVFGTMTFKGAVPRPAKCYGSAWRLMRHASATFGVNYSQLLLALREERGELGGRFHFHLLLGGLPKVNHSACFRLAYAWKGLTGGMSRFRIYDRALSGVSYVTKCLGVRVEQDIWRPNRANEYELAKFPGADQVTLSRSVLRVITAADRIRAKAAESPYAKTGV